MAFLKVNLTTGRFSQLAGNTTGNAKEQTRNKKGNNWPRPELNGADGDGRSTHLNDAKRCLK